MLHGVVLCGGHSRRMGSPKAMLPWGDSTLLSHAATRLRLAGLDPLCAGPNEWAAEIGCPSLVDEPAGVGPLGGIAAALTSGDCFVLAVDMPLLTADEIRRLVAAGAARRKLVLPRVAERFQPLAAYWPADILPALRTYLSQGGRAIHGFLDAQDTVCLDESGLETIGVSPLHFAGVNDPEAYRSLLTQALGGTSK